MDQLSTGILRRSSDAIIILGLADGTVLDVNGAFLTATGYARRELVGRPGRDLIVAVGQTADATAVDDLRDLGSIADAPIGLWTRSGELRVGDMSGLALEVEGQREAVCAIRALRDPMPGQRRSVAWEELDRILRSGDKWPEAATIALQAFGRCLQWEFGVLWRGAPGLEDLRCAAVWHAPQSELQQLEEATRHAAFQPGSDTVRRAWLRGEATWVPDASADPQLSRQRGQGKAPMRGWLAFPVRGLGGNIGLAEFLSDEVRRPDAELLAMIEDFGRLFGRLLEGAQGSDGGLVDDAGAVRPGTRELRPKTVPDAFSDLAGAVAAATEALARHSTLPARVEPPAVLRELAVGIGRLNRLLEDAAQEGAHASSASVPTAPSPKGAMEYPRALPTGLTLKAVSRRTGIPAATLRTWEHRYGFLRPRRSPAGHRLYGEEEITRIEQVKYLLGQGLRIGAAMRAMAEEAGEAVDGEDQ